MASAFSVILFIIMLALGYFYVKALTANTPRREGMSDDELPSRLQPPRAWHAGSSWRCWWPSQCVPMVWMFSTSIKTEFAAIAAAASPGSRPSRRSSSTRRSSHRPIRLDSNSWDTSGTAFGYQRRQQCSVFWWRCPRPMRSPASASRVESRSSSQCWCATCSRSWSSSSRSSSS